MTDGVAVRVEYAFRNCPVAGTVPVWFGAHVEANVPGRADVLCDDGGVHVFSGDVGDHVCGRGGGVGDHIVHVGRIMVSWERIADDNAEHGKRREQHSELHGCS